MEGKKMKALKGINSFIFKLGLTLVLLLMINAMEFEVTVSKERNSLFNAICDTVENGYSLMKETKKVLK
jgi:hypothetical protein